MSLQKYAKLGSSLVEAPVKPSKEHIKIVDNLPRPTSEHVCDKDGYWVLPKLTRAQVAENRRKAFVKYTDQLVINIQKGVILGEDVSGRRKRLEAMVAKIEADNPYPLEVQTYYNPVIVKEQ